MQLKEKVEEAISKLKNKISNMKRKELLYYTGIFIVVIGVIQGASALIDYGYIKTSSAQGEMAANSYRLFINGNNMGLVENREVGEQAIMKAIDNLTVEIGYDPDVTPEIRYYEEYTPNKDFKVTDERLYAIQQVVKNGIEVIKVKAYAMRIGDDFVVAVENQDAVKQVLQNAKKAYVPEDTSFDVTLTASPYNKLVEKPVILPVNEVLSNERTLYMSARTLGAADEADVVNAVDTAKAADDNAEETKKDENKILDMGFSEEVLVVETYVDSTKILTVDEATEMITKEHQEPIKYTVSGGDCPSTIASDHNMKLSELTELNPSLVDNELIQIGDELIVTVPEPELSITTVEEIVYNEPIMRETSYVENASKYVGTNTVIDSGADGEKKVTAEVTKINGKQVSKTVKNEEVVTPAKDKVVEKGTKKLPANAPTGKYVVPLASYKTISSGFGRRWGSFHYGTDFAASYGTTVRASDGGTVTQAGWSSGYGYLVEISHGNGVTTRYGHNSSISVKVGQKVAQYQQIAKVGSTGNSTGNHLHFEIRFDGVPANPMNYLSF